MKAKFAEYLRALAARLDGRDVSLMASARALAAIEITDEQIAALAPAWESIDSQPWLSGRPGAVIVQVFRQGFGLAFALDNQQVGVVKAALRGDA